VLDFTTPAAALEYARICTKLKKPIVIGSTGFNKTQQAELEDMAKRNTIFMSANMSWGVAVSNHLAKIAASMLSHEEFDCDILETHHRYKQDAPSGTALMLGHTIATARGIELQDALYSADQGRRPEGKIGFASLRSGGTIGHHEASFNSQSESIKITHIASDRSVFAAGALRVTRWVTYATPWPGRIYSMQDIMQTYRK
jgi:4-hydroxy-tetrahydrodipicolinate reductase